MSFDDPTVTDPALYRVIFENDRVRVLEYADQPGDRTRPHGHPDSVMVTLTSFRRRVSSGDRHAEIALEPGQVRWVPAQSHLGENVGDTATHAIFVELKGAGEPAPSGVDAPLGPAAG
jgi:quercetin dioxygenase-like cupin family protein